MYLDSLNQYHVIGYSGYIKFFIITIVYWEIIIIQLNLETYFLLLPSEFKSTELLRVSDSPSSIACQKGDSISKCQALSKFCLWGVTIHTISVHKTASSTWNRMLEGEPFWFLFFAGRSNMIKYPREPDTYPL